MKSYVIWLRFYWSLLRIQLTIIQHCLDYGLVPNIGDKPLAEAMLTLCTDPYMQHWGRRFNKYGKDRGALMKWTKNGTLPPKPGRSLLSYPNSKESNRAVVCATVLSRSGNCKLLLFSTTPEHTAHLMKSTYTWTVMSLFWSNFRHTGISMQAVTKTSSKFYISTSV